MGTYQILSPEMMDAIQKQKMLMAQRPTAQVTPVAPNNTFAGPRPLTEDGKPAYVPPIPPPPPDTRDPGPAPVIPQQSPNYSPDMMKQIGGGVPSEIAPYAQEKSSNPPAYDALQKFEQSNQRPLQGDYHPSVKRRILAGILGGFAGIGNPKAGADTAEGILNSPYKQDLNDYEARLQDKQRQYQEETTENKSREVSREKASKSEEDLARSKKDLSDSEYKRWLLTPEGIAAKRKSEHTLQPKDGLAVLTNGEKTRVSRAFDSDGKPTYTNSSGLIIKPELVKDFQTKEDSVGSPQEQMLKAVTSGDQSAIQNITKAMELSAKANGTFGANQGREQYYDTQSNLQQIKKLLEQKDLDNRDPKVTEALSKAVDANPQSLFSYDAKTQEDIRALRAKNGQVIPIKLGQQDLKRRETAGITKDLVTKIRKQLTDSDVASRIGLFAGKWDEKSRQFIGTNFNDPVVQEKAQNLRTGLTQLFNLEIQNLTGGTSKYGLQEKMKELQGRQWDDISILHGVLSAADEYANIAEQNVRKIEGTTGSSKEDKMKKMLEGLR